MPKQILTTVTADRLEAIAKEAADLSGRLIYVATEMAEEGHTEIEVTGWGNRLHHSGLRHKTP